MIKSVRHLRRNFNPGFSNGEIVQKPNRFPNWWSLKPWRSRSQHWKFDESLMKVVSFCRIFLRACWFLHVSTCFYHFLLFVDPLSIAEWWVIQQSRRHPHLTWPVAGTFRREAQRQGSANSFGDPTDPTEPRDAARAGYGQRFAELWPGFSMTFGMFWANC